MHDRACDRSEAVYRASVLNTMSKMLIISFLIPRIAPCVHAKYYQPDTTLVDRSKMILAQGRANKRTCCHLARSGLSCSRSPGTNRFSLRILSVCDIPRRQYYVPRHWYVVSLYKIVPQQINFPKPMAQRPVPVPRSVPFCGLLIGANRLKIMINFTDLAYQAGRGQLLHPSWNSWH